MAVNKIQMNTENGVETLIDLTGDSVTPESLAEGVTAHDASGKQIVGTMSSGGHTFVEEKDVNFYDYDGTLLYSYTLDEIQDMTELPPPPDWHDELVFYEWNWSLENIKAENCQIDVGALYDTNDSKAHLHITIDEYVSKVVSITVTGTGYIDWGDGSAIESVSASASTVYSHEYPSTGNYVIKVWSDVYIYLGYTSGSTNMFGETNSYGLQTALLRKAFIGTKCGLNRYVFANCTQLEYLTLNPNNGISYGVCQGAFNLVCCHIPKRGNTHNYYAFFDCYSLRVATVSDRVTHISAAQFRNCRGLKRLRGKKNITFSEAYMFYTCSALTEARGIMNSGNTGIFASNISLRKFEFDDASTGIPNQAFNDCFVLQSLDIPASVTAIGSQAFRGLYCIRKLKFNSTTPPTVANANAFENFSKDCIVEVPMASLEAYQNATNYSAIAAQMIGV